jgi:hypothetical protein
VKCSIIISVLDSHEVFRRQLLHFNDMLPQGFEVLIVDDGSEVPLAFDGVLGFPFRLLNSHDTRPWTNNLARNKAATLASGEYLLMTDIDHIITAEAVEDVRSFQGDMLVFSRQVAQLDPQGKICNLGATKPPHCNTFAIRKTLFERMGGYEQIYRGYGTDWVLRERYRNLVAQGLARPAQRGSTIYVITEAKWFHKLKRVKT